jgi:transcriptional regulator with XRE-family HTH domain
MSNRIDELLTKLKKEQGLTVTEFAARCDLPPTTIYNARKREDMGKITVDVFLKIAHGLGMTAEQLYYGEECELPEQPSFTSDEQTIVDGYRAADDRQRERLLDDARREIRMAESDAREKKTAI